MELYLHETHPDSQAPAVNTQCCLRHCCDNVVGQINDGLHKNNVEKYLIDSQADSIV